MDDNKKPHFRELKFTAEATKVEKKNVRKFYKQCKKEFIEENDYEEVNTKRFASECNEAIQTFDPAIHDAWVVHCPKGIDINDLIDRRIKMPGRRHVGELQVRATEYGHPAGKSIGYVNQKDKYDVRLLPFSGQLTVSKRLNRNRPAAVSTLAAGIPKPRLPLKFKLPVRHPFFGCNYKSHIELDKQTQKKLRHANKKSSAAAEKARVTGNFYKIQQLLESTKTLDQKEYEVRQSVLTGVRPKFMSDAEHPDYLNLLNGNWNSAEQEEEEEEQQQNGEEQQQTKTSSKKKHSKKHQNDAIKVEASEDEQPVKAPSKKKHSKHHHTDVIIKVESSEEEDEPTVTEKSKKRMLKTTETEIAQPKSHKKRKHSKT